MIYETLAAMADYSGNEKFDFTSTTTEAKAVLDDLRDGNTGGLVDFATASGSLTMANEVLTIGSRTITNDKTAVMDDYIVGMQDKTPRKVLEDNIDPASFRE
jgi:hypothetical protein